MEDILVAIEMFGSTVYSPAIEDKRKEYEALAAKPMPLRTARERKRWRDLSRQLSDARLLAPDDGPVTKAITNLRKELGLPEQ